MDAFVQAMYLPFLACLLLAGIHVYLGIHVLARKVIFVDLALAQIAALGSVFGAFLGYSTAEYPWHVKAISLLFTVFGAALFSLTRVRYERVPQEAMIGIAYAVALSMAILFSSHLAHGADELRELLAGSILWVEAPTLVFTAILYASIGALHYAFRRQFLTISDDADAAAAAGLNIRFWDFLFYLSFGLVVTSSVSIAGVLLVFSYLVIPAVIASLLAEGLQRRLIIGWSVGALVSFVGVIFSYVADLPSGPAIVVVFAAALIAVAVTRLIVLSQHKLRAFGIFGVSCLAVVFFVVFSNQLRHSHQEKIHARNLAEMIKSNDPTVRRSAAGLLASQERSKAIADLGILLKDPDDEVREEALVVIRELNDPKAKEPLMSSLAVEQDDYLKVEMAEALLELGEPSAIISLIDVMDFGEMEQARKDAFEHLSAHVNLSFPFSAETDSAKNDAQMAAFRHFWHENEGRLQFDPQTRFYKRTK